jgi:hypothetical protein
MKPIRSLLCLTLATVVLASNTPPGGAFHGCPVNGKAGDLTLNSLKNRTKQVETPEDITIEDILALPSSTVVTPLHRSQWTPKNKQLAAAQEKRGVLLDGFLIAVHQQGPEKCKCSDPEQSDFHIWIASLAKSRKPSAVVVEATPRWQEVNDAWELVNFQDLAKKKAHVRITGWLMYDQDHGSEVGHSRATLWEIHPVTKVEVEENGTWSEL